MTKAMVRSCFLYSFFVAAIVSFFVPHEKETIFIAIWIFSGVIAFTFEIKNVAAQVISVGASILVFGFLFFIFHQMKTISLLSFSREIAYSVAFHIGSACVFLLVHPFFEYLFDTKEWNKQQ